MLSRLIWKSIYKNYKQVVFFYSLPINFSSLFKCKHTVWLINPIRKYNQRLVKHFPYHYQLSIFQMYTQIFWLQVVFLTWLLLMVKYWASLCFESVDRLSTKWIYEVVDLKKKDFKTRSRNRFCKCRWLRDEEEKSIEKIISC